MNVYLTVCGIFYSVLCVFSLVTGFMYASGKKKLNPLELSDEFVKSLDIDEKLTKFTSTMGIVTMVVGVVQGITAISIFFWYNIICYIIGIGFTLFSIGSVSFKLKSKINLFPISKFILYFTILIILLCNL